MLGREDLETRRESGKGAPGYRVLPSVDQCLRRVEPSGVADDVTRLRMGHWNMGRNPPVTDASEIFPSFSRSSVHDDELSTFFRAQGLEASPVKIK